MVVCIDLVVLLEVVNDLQDVLVKLVLRVVTHLPLLLPCLAHCTGPANEVVPVADGASHALVAQPHPVLFVELSVEVLAELLVYFLQGYLLVSVLAYQFEAVRHM